MQRFELTCRLSHLGLTQATLTQTVDVMTGALSGTGVYVAANGDELAFTFTGTAELSFTDPTDATVTFGAVQDLSGGSGRFAPADGTAEVAGTTRLNLITGSGTGELTLDARWRTETDRIGVAAGPFIVWVRRRRPKKSP